MFPTPSLDDSEDSWMANTIAPGKSRTSVAGTTVDVTGSYILDIFFCKVCAVVLFAARLTLFAVSILYVFCVGTKEQVIRVNTTGVIAFMQHAHPRTYRTYIEFIGITMRRDRFTANSSSTVTPYTAAGPRPTLTTDRMDGTVLINLTPEPFLVSHDLGVFGGSASLQSHVVGPTVPASHERSRTTINGTRDEIVGIARHDTTPLVVPKNIAAGR